MFYAILMQWINLLFHLMVMPCIVAATKTIAENNNTKLSNRFILARRIQSITYVSTKLWMILLIVEIIFPSRRGAPNKWQNKFGITCKDLLQSQITNHNILIYEQFVELARFVR